MIIVAVLTVRRAREAELHRFETAAAKIMARHGGAIERTVVEAVPADSETYRELHLVRFPDVSAFQAYRADPELVALGSLRDSPIAATEVWIGGDGPIYG